jgi:hypothetical protein
MTDLSPAADLRAAAQLLLDLADETETEMETNTYWHSQIRPPVAWFANGIDNACGGPAGILAGLLSPPLARELADWMRGGAKFLDDVVSVHGRLTTQALTGVAHQLAAARHILTTTKEMTR